MPCKDTFCQWKIASLTAKDPWATSAIVKRMMDRGKGLGEKFRVGGESAVEFLEFGCDDYRVCRDVEVIVCRVVGEIPGSVEDGTKGFGFKNMDSLAITQCHKSSSTLGWLYV